MAVLKYKLNDKEGFLSILSKGEYYYVLTQKATEKVSKVNESGTLCVSYDTKDVNYQEVDVTVSHDEDLIVAVYRLLEEADNLYHKTLDRSLCVLEIPKLAY